MRRFGLDFARRRFGRGLVITSATIGIIVAGGFLFPLFKHPEIVPPSSPSIPPPISAKPMEAPDRKIARVGPRDLTRHELDRYRRLRVLVIGGMVHEAQAFEELCNRTLLELLARENNIRVSEEEAQRELFKRKIIIGAVAGAHAPMQPAGGIDSWRSSPSYRPRGGLGSPFLADWARARMPLSAQAPRSPLEDGDARLAQEGLSEDELMLEIRADAIANKVRDQLVYAKVKLRESEVRAAVRAATQASGRARPRRSKEIERTEMQLARNRMTRERGSKPLAALMAKLRERWPIRRLE